MKFIRKNGRIIPIKDKYPTGSEKVNLAIDAAQGVAEGVAARAFWSNKKIVSGIATASIGTDFLTAIRRAHETRKQGKGVLDFLKKEAAGYAVGYAGNAIGFGGAHVLMGLAKKYKAAQAAKMGVKLLAM